MTGLTWKSAFCNCQFRMSTQWPAINSKPKVAKNNWTKTHWADTDVILLRRTLRSVRLRRVMTHARGWVGRTGSWRHRGAAREQLEHNLIANLPWGTDDGLAPGRLIRMAAVARLQCTSQSYNGLDFECLQRNKRPIKNIFCDRYGVKSLIRDWY